jgi:hypothetical protein
MSSVHLTTIFILHHMLIVIEREPSGSSATVRKIAINLTESNAAKRFVDLSGVISVEKQTSSDARAETEVREPSTSRARSVISPHTGDTALSTGNRTPNINGSLAENPLAAEVKPLDLVQAPLSPQPEVKPEMIDITDDDDEAHDLELAKAKYEMLLAKYEFIYARNKARISAKALGKQSSME